MLRRWEYAQDIERCDLRAAEMALSAKDIVHWLAQWAWTFDPKSSPPLIPFDPFPRQVEMLRWLEGHEKHARDTRLDTEVVVDKAREMGATWVMVGFATHRWLFRPYYAIGFGSAKVDFVDRLGNPSTIFEKIRILLGELPKWMLPKRFNVKRDAGYLRILNPANNSVIVGEGGDNIGRSGRSNLYVVDEAAYLERPDLADMALMTNAALRVNVSTPHGLGNTFARKRFSFPPERVYSLRWFDDPRKTQQWYDWMKANSDPVAFAANVDLDYASAIEGVVIPAAWVLAARNLALPDWDRVAVIADNTLETIAGLDIAGEGANETVLCPRRGPVVLPLIPWHRTDPTQTAHLATRHCKDLNVSRLLYDVGGLGVGAKGTWKASENQPDFDLIPVNAGFAPTMQRWPEGKTSKELFANLRAEMWWGLRRRFEKTFRWVGGDKSIPVEELVSIPDDQELIAQLSMPLGSYRSNGKWQVESKDDMRRRGVKALDRADALCLAYCPLTQKQLHRFDSGWW